ncbi:MAG: hypothetical protein M1816_001368 [Peltula sp. TS41687]|nr:MAG: hypothetical protein M1816_001368 [Peltula sp. TS41687]
MEPLEIYNVNARSNVEWEMEDPWDSMTIPHGVKRPAEDSLEGEQPLAKRLSRLSLQDSGKVNANISGPRSREQPFPKSLDDETPMQIDDTRDRIYIYNLEDELSSDGGEAEDERLVFIPEIEKRLTKIPKSVLANPTPPATSTELVLYNVPSSLSVPEEQDSVRKAIIETRARAWELQAERSRLLEQQEGNQDVSLANGFGQDEMDTVTSEDVEVMDIG